MKKRIYTGILMALILGPAIIVPECKTIFEIIVILFTIVASLEILNMYDTKKKLPGGVKTLCVILTLLLYAAVVNNFKETCANTLVIKTLDFFKFDIDMFTTMGAIFLILMATMIFETDFDAEDVGKCLFEILYVGLCFASFTVLRSYGVRFIIYLLTVTVCTDVFALVFGLTIGKKVFHGKHKMAPKISPNKSWEGAIGGSTVAVIVGFLVLFFYDDFSHFFHGGESVFFFESVFDYQKFTRFGMIMFMITLTLFMSICSQIGDLVASKLKRKYGIKDYSQIFPGHGGVLDRFDSAIFASAIFLVLIRLEAVTFPLIEQFPGVIQ